MLWKICNNHVLRFYYKKITISPQIQFFVHCLKLLINDLTNDIEIYIKYGKEEKDLKYYFACILFTNINQIHYEVNELNIFICCHMKFIISSVSFQLFAHKNSIMIEISRE